MHKFKPLNDSIFFCGSITEQEDMRYIYGKIEWFVY